MRRQPRAVQQRRGGLAQGHDLVAIVERQQLAVAPETVGARGEGVTIDRGAHAVEVVAHQDRAPLVQRLQRAGGKAGAVDGALEMGHVAQNMSAIQGVPPANSAPNVASCSDDPCNSSMRTSSGGVRNPE